MKVSLKFCRFSLVLLLALTVAFSAAVGVSADDTTIEVPAQLITANSFRTITYRNVNSPFNINSGSGYYTGLYINNAFEKNNTYVITATISVKFAIRTDFFGTTLDTLTLENNKVSSLSTNNLIDNGTLTYSDNGNARTYIITFNTNNIDSDYYNALYFLTKSNITSSTNASYEINNLSVYASYDPSGTTLDDINVQINNLINQNIVTNNKLDTLIETENNSSNNINQALQNIITNQETQNNYWQEIINYGSDYNQIDQTIINNLGSAEDQLSSAEGALENKSQSLKDSVATQWSNIQSTSKTFITNLAPAAAAVGTVTTQFMDAAPEEVKGLFVTIPLLIFIGWLIGRIRGD